MANRPQKLDLLRECNDQQMAPREFMGIFCNRCRNAACVNAGWSGGKWADRMLTQVDRLLDHPQFADPSADRFDPLRKLDFRELSEGLVLRTKADPWSGPEVHLADPERETASNSVVEDAVRALSASRTGIAEPEPARPAPPPPPAPEPPPPEPRRNPAFFKADQMPEAPPPAPQPQPQKPVPVPLMERMVNTPFPQEGVMLDGSPPVLPTASPTSGGDPWAPPPSSNPSNNKAIRVSVGAKVKMGG
jgi:hypothetical protein